MALSAKPPRPAAKVVDPVEVFLSKGSTTAADPALSTKAGKAAQHPLKFPEGSDLFERLERVRAASVVKLPRNTWILQAIAEKLDREA